MSVSQSEPLGVREMVTNDQTYQAQPDYYGHTAPQSATMNSSVVHQNAGSAGAPSAYDEDENEEFDHHEWNSPGERNAQISDQSDAAMVDKAMAFIHNAQPVSSHASYPHLQKPIAIPQVSPALGAPFVRAYAEVLQAYNIHPVEFVEFIDNFNVLLTGSPPLTALNIAGQAMSFVPVHYVGLAGTGLQFAVGLGKYAMIKTRCAHFVQRSNEHFFLPRGLKVKIVKTEHVAKICGVSLNDITVRPLSSGEEMTALGGPLDRRLNAVAGYVEHLTLDVPPPVEQSHMLAKMSAKESAYTENRMNKKTMKEREKAMEKMPTAPEGPDPKTQKKLDKLKKEEAKVLKKETDPKKIKKEMRKIEEERSEVLEDAGDKKDKDREDYLKEDKEIKKSKKGLWMVVFNKDAVQVWEAEEEKRKAQGPMGFLHRSRK